MCDEMSVPIYESHLNLPLIRRGKVRDIYEVDAQHLLIIATDRLSAFDVVMPTPIPGKGAILTTLSNFWFHHTAGIITNHLQLASKHLADALPNDEERAAVAERAVVVRRVTPLPIEAIVRGYLMGSGWRDYQRTGCLGGMALPAGLTLASPLPEPMYTPSTKAAVGEHDVNVDFNYTVEVLGAKRAERVRAVSLALYQTAAAYAATRGIVIADTKFEFGLDEEGDLVLIDELLTPDSSRFWPVEQYQIGHNPPSFDKQFVRDYLDRLAWDKRPPAPALPPDVVAQTVEKYREVQRRLLAE